MEQDNSNKSLIPVDTPAETLEKLANSESDDIRRQVASNPNTPPNILKKLFPHYPIEVLTNPIIDLVLIENPLFYKELCELCSIEDLIIKLIDCQLSNSFI